MNRSAIGSLSHIPSRWLRIEEGSKVEANYRGEGKYFPGRIKRDRGDGTFDIEYNDGEQVFCVQKDMIRLLDAVDGGGAKGLIPSRRLGIKEGSKVEANYRGKGKYYPGRIKRDRGDGTFDVDYDDGEFETRVSEDMIRLLDVEGESSRSDLVVGAAVEVNVNGNGTWCTGKIQTVGPGRSYDIVFDDGKSEIRVPEDKIRLLDAVDGNLEVVALLLEKGADPDLADKVSFILKKRKLNTQIRVRTCHYIFNVPYLLEYDLTEWQETRRCGRRKRSC